MRTQGLIYNEGNNWEIVIGGQRVAISSEGFSFYKWYNLVYAQCVIQWKIGGLKVLETHPKKLGFLWHSNRVGEFWILRQEDEWLEYQLTLGSDIITEVFKIKLPFDSLFPFLLFPSSQRLIAM